VCAAFKILKALSALVVPATMSKPFEAPDVVGATIFVANPPMALLVLAAVNVMLPAAAIDKALAVAASVIPRDVKAPPATVRPRLAFTKAEN
jgi:hypothetical protein